MSFMSGADLQRDGCCRIVKENRPGPRQPRQRVGRASEVSSGWVLCLRVAGDVLREPGFGYR